MSIKFIESKLEERIGAVPNFICLYECGHFPNIEDLIELCKKEKERAKDERHLVMVFFNKKSNAQFPSDIAPYIKETKLLKHIKALFTFNQNNGYSRLSYYYKNGLESPGIEIDVF